MRFVGDGGFCVDMAVRLCWLREGVRVFRAGEGVPLADVE